MWNLMSNVQISDDMVNIGMKQAQSQGWGSLALEAEWMEIILYTDDNCLLMALYFRLHWYS